MHPHCCRFFDEFPIEGNTFYYPKKVREEVKYKRNKISREKSGFEYELRRLSQFVNLFLEKSQKLDYENSEHAWNSIFFTVQDTMKKCLQMATNKVSFDANHIAHYICFCDERDKNTNHFFITRDIKMYDIRRELWKTACKILDREIYFSIKNIWNF